MNRHTPLHEVQQYLEQHRDDGVICPACDQMVKVYKRKLNSSMALVLFHIYRFFRSTHEQWLHVPSFIASMPYRAEVLAAIRGDWAKLGSWGLIEQKPAVRGDGSDRSGYWRITELGRDFIEHRCVVPRFAFFYNQEVLKFSEGENISIEDALEDPFIYRELFE